MVGRKFGRLTVISEAWERTPQCSWICLCDCGNTTDPIPGYNLRSGRVVSCGCRKRDGKLSSLYKHGGAKTKLYEVFKTMHRRCEAETSNRFSYYGARGISVCEEWKDFRAFREWAHNNGYAEGLTLDRIDNNGDYCPENCRWATVKQQSNNRRNNVYIEIDGQLKTAAQWSDLTGIPYRTIYGRYKSGLTGKEVIRK